MSKHFDIAPRIAALPAPADIDQFVRGVKPVPVNNPPVTSLPVDSSTETKKPVDVSTSPRVAGSSAKKRVGTPMRKLGIYIPEPIFRQFAARCGADDVTISDAITRLIEQALRSNG